MFTLDLAFGLNNSDHALLELWSAISCMQGNSQSDPVFAFFSSQCRHLLAQLANIL